MRRPSSRSPCSLTHPGSRVKIGQREVAVQRGLLQLIGNTPLLRLDTMETEGSAELYAKLESMNPGGSIKDRVALAMVEEAEDAGLLTPGSTVVEVSGGNMGVSLAMVASAKGYRSAIVMPENAPQERRRLIARFGASLHLTPSDLGMVGAKRAAQRMTKQNKGYVLLDQFASAANPRAHYLGTGREILDALGDRRVDAFVAGVGTGGTITGVGQALKGKEPSVQVIAVEPATSPLLSEGRFGEHGIVGLGADFIPEILDRESIDEVVTVGTQEALDTMQELAKKVGTLVGVSSGANVFAAMKTAQRLGRGKVVVTVLPDTGERYPSLYG